MLICRGGPYFVAMAKKTVPATSAAAPPTRPPYTLIEEIRVQGYKSLVGATLHVRPLTLLAGTNSSGKSSIMQPLLLIKQTMEVPYQPAGALVLDGAHVQAETAGELVSKGLEYAKKEFVFSIIGTSEFDNKKFATQGDYAYSLSGMNFSIAYQQVALHRNNKQKLMITPSSTWADIHSQLHEIDKARFPLAKTFAKITVANAFLDVQVLDGNGTQIRLFSTAYGLRETLYGLFHIPGLRGAPQRSYPATGIQLQNRIKGTFDFYAAGTISQWQQQSNNAAISLINSYLYRLGLTDSVISTVKTADKIELSVSRLPAGSKGKPKKADMVNIADVGIGVSQVLPILVALIAAQEGQIVYVEQPELHLHPRAQVVMAELLAEAANRGVRVIVETHSSLLLLTVQTLVAQNKIKNTDVALHWFARDAKGATQVTHVQPDEDGAYGEWPEDFGDVELRAQDAYLTAVGLRKFGKAAHA